MFSSHLAWFLLVVAHEGTQYKTNPSQNWEEISYLHLFQRSRPPSSQVQTCYSPHICRYRAQHICVVFHPYLLPKHVCLAPPSPSLGHSPLGQELSWKTEIWQLRVYFKPETFQTGKRGERGAKTNLTGKETEIALISLLSPC